MTKYIILFFFLNLIIYIFNTKIIKFYDLYDLPNSKRKIHTSKTSIVGGLFFFLNILLYVIVIYFNKDFSDFNQIFLSDFSLLYFSLTMGSFFIFGYLDDKYNLNANLKLLILISLVFFILKNDNNLLISNLNLSFSNKIIFLDKYSFIFTLFCFIAFINAFNLFDGINCQIGIYVLFIFFILFTYNNNLLLVGSVLFALIPFLTLNLQGKIFIGNAGSYFLGFIISYVFIKTYNNTGYLYSDKILLIMLLPGIDMIRLFFIRIKNKRNPFSPDRNHLHHKLREKLGYLFTIQIITILSVLPYLMSLLLDSYICIVLFIIFYFSLNNFLNSIKNFK